MAKKKINILLIVVVLALWGTVGYRTLNRQFTGNEMIPELQNKQGNITINQINKDTFKLEKVSRDPFLNKQFQTAVTAPRRIVSNYRSVKKTSAPPVVKTDPNLHWPMLAYCGYIGNKERNEELVLLKIDSKLFKLKLNDQVNGLVVKKRYKDSIEVFFNSQTRMVRLK
jgi:hypothetical protein